MGLIGGVMSEVCDGMGWDERGARMGGIGTSLYVT